MLAAGFEPALPASEQKQTYVLDGAPTGIGSRHNYRPKVFAIFAFHPYIHICIFVVKKMKLISLAPGGVLGFFFG